MERFKSTLGTTATIVLGLVLAAHLRNGGHEELQAPRPSAATVATWTDPPADFAQARLGTTTMDTVTFSPATAPMMAGSVAVILPAGMSAPLPPRTAAAGRTFETARHTARVREASANDGKDVTSTSPARTPGKAAEPDAIGALIRDLDAERRS